MKIITRAVLDWDGNVLEEDSYEYDGPVAECKDSGSSPQPVDPWQQAAAQYQLSTGTANYNAGLNRTNSVNPLGSDTWSSSSNQGIAFPTAGGGASTGTTVPTTATNPYGSYQGNLMGGAPMVSGLPAAARGGIGFPVGGTSNRTTSGSGAPTWTETTSLSPQFNAMLQQPINDYNVVGDAGVGAAAKAAESAAYDKNMAYLTPEFAQQDKALEAKLANQGITPGSEAYDYEHGVQDRSQTFSRQQAIDSAIGTGQSSLSNMANIGSSQLQNELAARNAPISEFNALRTGASSPVSAATPDISGAFNQQYQGQLAGYNANVATNNSNTSAVASLAAAAAIYF